MVLLYTSIFLVIIDKLSMIETIEIDQVATYANHQKMVNLKEINFIFGTNGAGKTTIGRVIEHKANPEYGNCSITWRNGIEIQPLVYNRDFVDANFNLSENLKGIFTLGEKDIANEKAIKAKREDLDRYSNDIAQWTNTLGNTTKKSGKQKELADLEEEIKNLCWLQKRKLDSTFWEVFTGTRNDAVRFKERVLQQYQSNMAEKKTLEYLTERADTLFGKTPQRQTKIPTFDFMSIVALEENPILAKKVVGRKDVDIANMIDYLGHSDWVKVGQVYFQTSQPNCPFCQQRVTEGLKASLESYFDETFEKDTQAIIDLQVAYDLEKKSVSSALEVISTSTFIDKEALARQRTVIDTKLQTNTLILSNKHKEPSLPQQLESLTEYLKAVFDLVEVANVNIVLHNKLIDDISGEKTKLIAQVWRYILDDMKVDLDQYTSKKTGLNAAIESLKKQIRTAEEAKAKVESELSELEKTATSVQPTIDAINHLLASFGFKTFKLTKSSEESHHYKLIRNDGKDAMHSLSEGEKSFVTFLYFYHLVKGSNTESGTMLDRIVVFDDPVSSMDSDVLFIVSNLIRSLFDDMKNGRGYVKQVFVLTHNVYFHKEVSFVSHAGQREKTKKAENRVGHTYWVVRKSPTGSRIESSKDNPVKTSYDLLWDEVRRDERNPLTIQNTMRRILEHYFKIIGGIDFDKLCEQFHGREKLECHSLLSWVNDGSHSSHDDAYFAFAEDAIDNQVKIFKKIFEYTQHLSHYDMMMAKKPAI
jgi:wobble nucleotide-excising tRNase